MGHLWDIGRIKHLLEHKKIGDWLVIRIKNGYGDATWK